MEERNEENDMDTNNVYVVRSAKGVDMLCVDDYLYHFDRIGKNNTYRWLCNRRKDKLTPCKSRLSTMLPDPLDKSIHVVVDVASGHPHARCSAHEIAKVSQRKRLSNIEPEPYKTTQPKRARLYERATASMNPPEWISTETAVPTNLSSSIVLDFEDKDRVYMLRRRDGRVMICTDGHLYYLCNRSYKGDIYRWSCVRQRDIDCTALITTETTLSGGHRLRSMEPDSHLHPHYSAGKLMHMFAKHQIILVDDEQTSEVLEDCPGVQYFDPDQSYESDPMRCDDLESLIVEDGEENDNYSSTVADPDDNIDVTMLTDFDASRECNWLNGNEVIESYVAPATHNPLTETDLSKFTFLPSAKGKKVLCLNRHLFHFDSQSRSNGHMFFTCIFRRDKEHQCHVRVTLKPIERKPPVVIRINGEHTHQPDLQEILKRMNRLKKQMTSGLLRTKQEEEEYIKVEQDEAEHAVEQMQSFEADNLTASESIDSTYEQLEDHLQSSNSHRSVVMKKVIGIDGIKMEPAKTSMIVEYNMKDGLENISAKIQILPNALEGLDEHQSHSIPPTAELAEELSADYTAPQPEITNMRRRKANATEPDAQTSTTQIKPDMDLTKICTLRSAKGSEMLCVDGYIFHAKNRGLISRNYWVCIKSRDPKINCKSRISTATQKDGTIRVLRVYNSHTHDVNYMDIKRRLFNEINKRNNKKLKFRPLHFLSKSIEEINEKYGDLAIDHLNVSNIAHDIVVHKKPRVSGGSLNDSVNSKNSRTESPYSMDEHIEDCIIEEGEIISEDQYIMDESGEPTVMENTDSIIEEVEEATDMDNFTSIENSYTMKLYAVSDGPPSLAVRMTLKALDIEHQLVNVDFCALEHRSENYAKMNPQKEIPVLDDDGFYLSESIAIMQYLCDKYAPDSTLYPHDVHQRALVNQRLCFNMGFYYAPISAHAMAPIFFDYERTPMSQKKVENALEVLETYLQRSGTKYIAGDDVTIADFALISATLCLEAIDFDLSPYTLVKQWYATFKAEYPELWEIAKGGMKEIQEFEQNPPDLSHVEHPFHPTRKNVA